MQKSHLTFSMNFNTYFSLQIELTQQSDDSLVLHTGGSQQFQVFLDEVEDLG